MTGQPEQRHSMRRIGFVAAAFAGAAAAALLVWLFVSGRPVPIGPTVAPDPGRAFREALAAIDRDDPAAAAVHLRDLKGVRGYEAHRRLIRGGILLRRGHPAEALREFVEVKQSEEVLSPSLRLTGEALYLVGRLREAEFCFRGLSEREPESAVAHRWLAAVYYDLGLLDLTETHLKRLAELAPEDYAPHRLLGVIHKDYEQYRLAAENFQAALDRGPPEPVRDEIAADLAHCLMKEQDFEGALAALGEGDGFAALRSECLWNLGRIDEAKREAARAERVAPDSVATSRWFGLMKIQEGDLAGGIGHLRRALERDPHNVECRYQLALALQRSGESDESAAEMARVDHSKRLLSSLTALSSEAATRPYDADIRDRMANVCDELGRHELATSWRKTAQSLRQSSGSG